MKKVDIAIKGRTQVKWGSKRQRSKGISPSESNLRELIRPRDFLDDISSISFTSGEDHIKRQLKRKKNASRFDRVTVPYEKISLDLQNGIVPDIPTEVKLDDGCEWMPPNEFGIRLRSPFILKDHQVDAIRWQLKRESTPLCGVRGGIHSIEMGLGKSLISLVTSMSTWSEGKCASLIVMPKTLMTNYMLDAAKFFGRSIRILLWDREILGKSFFDFTSETPFKNHIVIVSYDTVLGLAKSLGILSKSKGGNIKLRNVAEFFYATPWFRVICDESHRLANHKSQLWESMIKLKPSMRMCLTGTAIRNYEDDLFSQMKFCGLAILPDHREWTIGNYKLHGLHDIVFSKRVSDCELKLPPKEEIRHYVELSEYEKNVYNVLIAASSKILDAFKMKNAMFANVLETFTRLRQTCIAPHLIAPECKLKSLTVKEKERLIPGSLLGNDNLDLENILRNGDGHSGVNSSKMREMVKIAKSIPTHEKMLIFTEWSSAAHLASKALSNTFGNDAVVVVCGDTKNKDSCFSRFKLDPKVRFLCCTSVATQGLTLIEANHALTLSTTWCSSTIEQFYARIWRIGQTKKCFMWQLVVKGSVESRMLEICETKHNIRDILLHKGVNADIIDSFIGKI